MRLDVVRVAVEAVGVVGHDHVGAYLVDDRFQLGGGLVHVGLPEAARVVVVRQPHHPGIAPSPGAAEEPVVGHAQRLAGGLELPDPVLAQLVRQEVPQRGRDDLAKLAERAGHERHPGAFGRVLGHRRPGPDRLVIRVRVHQQQARL